MTIDFCTDDELGYRRSRTCFIEGTGLALDETYRLAHLPLVAPHHPRVIAAREGTAYHMGRHAPAFSLALPISARALFASEAYRALEGEIRASAFAAKIAWDLLNMRRDKLHATLCGPLTVARDAPAGLGAHQLQALSRLGQVNVELRGLFSGNVNVGRLYLRVYPERRDGGNVLRHIQRTLGRRETDLYVVGLFNLVDDLNAAESAALDDLIRRWWDRRLLRFAVDHLWLLQAMDDLVLDGGVAATVPLREAGAL